MAIHLRWTADFLPDNLMYLIAAHANLKADHHFIWKRGEWFCGNWCEAMVKMSDDHTKLDAYAWPLGSSMLRTHREYMDKLRSVIIEVIAGELTRRRKQDIIVEEVLFWQDQYVQDTDDEEIFLRRVIDHLHSGMEEIHLDKFNRSVSIRDLLYRTYLNPGEIINNYQNYRSKLSGGS